MADQKITELDELTTPVSTDLLPIVEDPGGTPKTEKITLERLGLTNGWFPITKTLVYASPTTFTIADFDATAVFQRLDKLKLTNSGDKYLYIESVVFDDPGSTITVVVDTSYALADAAITAPFYSRANLPFGFPDYFNTAKCRAYSASGETDLAKLGYHLIEYDTETYDTGSNFNTSTHQFTAPITGYYFVVAAAEIINATQDDRMHINIFQNGDARTRNQTDIETTDRHMLIATDILFCGAGEVIEAKLYNFYNTFDYVGVTTETYMTIHLISI